MLCRALTLLACVLLLGGCGGDGAKPPPTPEPPAQSEVPDDPPDALEWVRAAHDGRRDAELRRRLAAWPLEHDDFAGTEESQVVLTWRLRLALQDGRLKDAVTARADLLRQFEGHGVSPEGRGLTPEMIRLGLLDEARLLSRRHVEGARPDLAGALAAWQVGVDLLQKDDAEDRERLARTHRWATVHDMGAWLRAVDLAAGEALGAPLGVSRAQGPETHPFVVVLADDFALGEIIFADVLRRWLRQGREVGLRGVLVPLKRGEIRMGLRRVPTESDEEEVTSLGKRAKAIGLRLVGDPKAGLIRGSLPRGNPLAEAMGVEGQEAALLIVDRRGRIVGRLSGVGIDPRDLDPVLQKLVSR